MIIERTTEKGYDSKTIAIIDSIDTLNNDIEEGRQLWINNRPFMKKIILPEDLNENDKISVTNKLVGG